MFVRFGRDCLKTTLFLGKCLTLAFELKSLMVAYIAVFALVKRPVFALYISFALSGSSASGLLYQFWLV